MRSGIGLWGPTHPIFIVKEYWGMGTGELLSHTGVLLAEMQAWFSRIKSSSHGQNTLVSSIEPVILSMSYLEHNSHTRKSTLLAIETYPEALSIGHLESEQCQLALVVGQ